MGNTDEVQFGFVPGRGTTDAIFIVSQLQGKYIVANKLLYFAFVHSEKAFDRVPISLVVEETRCQWMGCVRLPGHVIQRPESCVSLWPIDGRPVTELDVDGTMFDVEATFCYLGDMMCSGELVVAMALPPAVCGWGEVQEPLACPHHQAPFTTRFFATCVLSVMLYSSKTWEPNASALQHSRLNDCDMICWICGTKHWDETLPVLLL